MSARLSKAEWNALRRAMKRPAAGVRIKAQKRSRPISTIDRAALLERLRKARRLRVRVVCRVV